MNEIYKQLKCSKCGVIVQAVFPEFNNACFNCLPVKVQEKLSSKATKQTQTKAG